MNNKYNDLFDTLIKAYYDGDFDDTFMRIMGSHESSPQETYQIITSLCGVDIPYDNNYLYNLKKAITNFSVNENFIKKLDGCITDCPQDTEDNFKCQKACPFDAITYNAELNHTIIENDRCIHCGLCVDACKDGRILDRVEFIPIIDLIRNNKVVIAAVAPAISGQFGPDTTLDQLRAAFIKLGFSDMIEVAFAADMLTVKEAVEFDKHVNKPDDLMITSCCCPMWVGMLKKVYKELVPDLSPSVSPMIAAGRVIKNLNPEAKVVFIGPCVAKKAEAKDKDIAGAIDFVLTFQEVDEIFKVFSIAPGELTGVATKEYASRGGRLYARTGGVSTAIHDVLAELYPEKSKIFNAVQAQGIKECKELLASAINGDIKANFIEGMGCNGGCVGGPKIIVPPEKGRVAVDNAAYNAPIKVPVHSSTMDEVLGDLGINSLKDFEDPTKIQIFERDFK